MSVVKQYLEEKWGERLPEQPSWIGKGAKIGKGAALGGGIGAIGGTAIGTLGGPLVALIGFGAGGILGILYGVIITQVTKTADDRYKFINQLDKCVLQNKKNEKQFIDCVRKRVRGGKELSETELKILYRSRKYDPEVGNRAARAAEKGVSGLTNDPQKKEQLKRIARVAGKAAGDASEKRKREKFTQQLCGGLKEDEYLRCLAKYGLLSPEEAREYMEIYG